MSGSSDEQSPSGDAQRMEAENHTIVRGVLYLSSLLLIALAVCPVFGLNLPGISASAEAYIAGGALVTGTLLYISAAFLRTGFVTYGVGWKKVTSVERIGAVGAVVGLGILFVAGGAAVRFAFDPAATTSSPVLLFGALCLGALLFAGGIAATRPVDRGERAESAKTR